MDNANGYITTPSTPFTTPANRYAAIVRQRAAAVAARHAGRQVAHDAAASARAAKKRDERRHARGPRGQTQVIGNREDGAPIYRAVPAFRARPYRTPEDRAKRPDVGALPIAGMRSHEVTRRAANKAEAPQVLNARKVRMATRRRRGW